MSRSASVAVAGEALVDLVQAAPAAPFEAFVGGSPANVAVGLARLGVPTRLVARLGVDVLGRQIRRHLERNGVDLSRSVTAAEPSTLALAAIGEDGAADYDFRVVGTADWQWDDEELAGAFDGVVCVHSGSLALAVPPGRDVLLRALAVARGHATISYDPNFRPLLMGARAATLPYVDRVLGLVDVVKASSEDTGWLRPGTPPEQVAAEWVERGAALVAITLGSAGALAVAAGTGVVRVGGRPVDVVDTIGAGDAFTSALLAGLLRRSLLGAARRAELRAIDAHTLRDVVQDAVLASALTCTRRGAGAPTAAELEVFRLAPALSAR